MPSGRAKLTCFSILAFALAVFVAGCAATKTHTREGELASKAELIRDLNPPAGCEEVQEKGRRAVDGMARFTFDVVRNLTPYL